MKKMKVIVGVLLVVSILSLSLVSAGWWSDFWNNLFGRDVQLSPGSVCWNGSNQYIDSDASKPVDKFCKCAMGDYGHNSKNKKTLDVTAYIYSDLDDNTNWAVVTHPENDPVYQVKCRDSELYDTNVTYYEGGTCIPNWVNGSWSAWTNLNCVVGSSQRNQSRSIVETDSNGCPGSSSKTYYEYRTIADATCPSCVPGTNVCANKCGSVANGTCGNVTCGTCGTGYTCTNNVCLPNTPASCIGTIPGNATICTGDDSGLTANTTRTLVASCGTPKCQYLCNAGYTLSGGVCVASSTYSCIGTIPGNATLCTGDSIALAANTNRTLVDSCGTPKCEYTCNSGYALSGGVCVATSIYNCTGTIPGNATLCTGDNLGLIININRTLVSSCGTPKCEYTCDSGYNLSGGVCVALSCVPESNDTFCSRLDKTCGIVTANDNCNISRVNVSCGSCTSGYSCTNNSCLAGSCTAESNTSFCSRLSKTCGSVTANDSCNITRTNVSCGSCISTRRCVNNICVLLTTSTSCVESWTYSGWSACSGGVQTRTANDVHYCNTTTNRSSLTQSCEDTTSTSSTPILECTDMGEINSTTYCDSQNLIQDKKSKDLSCDNNYECESDSCVDNVCESNGSGVFIFIVIILIILILGVTGVLAYLYIKKKKMISPVQKPVLPPQQRQQI